MRLGIRTVVHASGERVALLFSEQPYQPILTPLLWVTLARRSCSYRTILQDVQALKAFYEYCGSTGTDAEASILDQRFSDLLARFASFMHWLKSRRKTRSSDVLSPSSVNSCIGSLASFLTWCAYRYVPSSHESEVTLGEIHRQRVTLVDHLNRLVSDNLLPVRLANNLDGLTTAQIDDVRQFIHPENSENPYPPRARIRNSVVFDLLMDTGMRRSELLKLQTRDFCEVNGRFVVSVTDRTGDPNDSRKYEPGFKTLPRTIEVTKELYRSVEDYIDAYRRPVDRNGRPKKLGHLYLVTNQRGNPLDSSYINKIFIPLKTRLGMPNISPHTCRNTFANAFLEFCVESLCLDLEVAADKLRYICGWAAASPMPQRYARRYIAKLANSANRTRIESAWKRVHRRET